MYTPTLCGIVLVDLANLLAITRGHLWSFPIGVEVVHQQRRDHVSYSPQLVLGVLFGATFEGAVSIKIAGLHL